MLSELNYITVAVWLATYLLHSTILLGAVWLLTRYSLRRWEGMKEIMWKLALVTPVLSATLQIGLSIEPVTGGLSVARSASPVASILAVPSEMGSEQSPVDASADLISPGVLRRMHATESTPPGSYRRNAANAGISGDEALPPSVFEGLQPLTIETSQPESQDAGGGLKWTTVAMAVLGLAMIVPAVRCLMSWRRLSLMMRRREQLVKGPLFDKLQRLRSRSGMRRTVRLSSSDRIAAPIAFGIIHPEICLPRRVVERLSEPEQESILAHELAHLLRYDPVWLAIVHMIERLFFIQPLNRVGCRKLRELAEFRCDEWAAEQTGDRLTLARCLTEVAGWVIQQRSAAAMSGMAGMAGNPSELRQRVGRLLDDAPLQRNGPARHWIAALLPVVVAFITLTAPGVIAKAPPAVDEVDAVSDSSPAVYGGGEVVAAPTDDLMSDLTTLDNEIALLERKIALLSPDDELSGIIDDVKRKAGDLGRRRDRLAAMWVEMHDETNDEIPGNEFPESLDN